MSLRRSGRRRDLISSSLVRELNSFSSKNLFERRGIVSKVELEWTEVSISDE